MAWLSKGDSILVYCFFVLTEGMNERKLTIKRSGPHPAAHEHPPGASETLGPTHTSWSRLSREGSLSELGYKSPGHTHTRTHTHTRVIPMHEEGPGRWLQTPDPEVKGVSSISPSGLPGPGSTGSSPARGPAAEGALV